MRNIGGLVWHGPANLTNQWQPVDAGPGKVMKDLIAGEQEAWLDRDDNLDLWHGKKYFDCKEYNLKFKQGIACDSSAKLPWLTLLQVYLSTR